MTSAEKIDALIALVDELAQKVEAVEASHRGLKKCVLSVQQRGFDVIRDYVSKDVLSPLTNAKK